MDLCSRGGEWEGFSRCAELSPLLPGGGSCPRAKGFPPPAGVAGDEIRLGETRPEGPNVSAPGLYPGESRADPLQRPVQRAGNSF